MDGIEPAVDPGVFADAAEQTDGAVAIRRRIHAYPETGLHLPVTQETVLDQLDTIGLTGTTGQRCSSVVAVLEGDRSGPTTLLRADMDALEMPEDTGLDYASKVAGKMHACGHDAHVAMLLGAARLLQDRRGELAGRVVLMFQPGEEGHDGARTMIDEGLLDRYGQVDRAFALHISAMFPSGWLSTRAGTIMASADEFCVTVTGRGGHASMPHDAVDPLPAACQIVTSIQSMVTRRIPAFDPAVITISTIHGGSATNVIPENVVCGGTLRAISDRSRQLALSALRQLCEHVAAAHGCSAEVRMEPGNYPVTSNNADFAEHTLRVAAGLIGPDQVYRMPTPIMGAEDWSHILRSVPGSMAFLGACPPGVDRPEPNHSNRFVIDESAMTTGIAMYAAMALTS